LSTDSDAGPIPPLEPPPTAPSMRVLAAEDNPIFQSMLRNMLTKWGYQAVIARSGTEAWQILEAPDAPRLAVLDWMMPGIDGVEICKRIREANREPYIYILLLTARTESQDLIQGMDAGADDYLTKPFNAHELRVRLNAGRRILMLQQELLLAREKLRDQATHDSLTGLLNRGCILEKLDEEISRTRRANEPLSVVMADLDRFKLINDTYGHPVGDQVIRGLAWLLKGRLRSSDMIGRYGGEEFLIALSDVSPEKAAIVIERIREDFSSLPHAHPNGTLFATFSAGIASYPNFRSAISLTEAADNALLEAKRLGRNRVEKAIEQTAVL